MDVGFATGTAWPPHQERGGFGPAYADAELARIVLGCDRTGDGDVAWLDHIRAWT